MNTPFLFGKTVSTELFTNRTDEKKRLKDNFINKINTILISPRRWGKSSLVKKVAEDVQGRTTRVVMLDMMSIRNEEEFYSFLTTQVIKATSNKLTEWVDLTKQFLKHITPKISLGNDPAEDFEISFEWKEINKNYRELLNLPEKIAIEKNIRIIICIDEFQNLESFKDPLLFQKRLRAEWQHHQHVTYCLYGSKQHMMMELFENQSMPFYKFGDVMYLPKIKRADWIKFIETQFASTNKNISKELANDIAERAQDHSYYVQQLSHLVWLHTDRRVAAENIAKATIEITEQNALLYSRDTEDLTGPQLNFLKAVANGVHNGLSSKAVIDQYDLGTSANVLKIKKTLIKKELVDDTRGDIFFLDPIYQLWFRLNILRQKIV
jgi:AAA+ ATPase superfamily predicted ATPase